MNAQTIQPNSLAQLFSANPFVQSNKFNLRSYLTPSKIFYHFVIGFVSAWLGASFISTMVIHSVWEIVTNSTYGQAMFLKLFNKNFADKTWQESAMDNLLFVLGWIMAEMLFRSGLIGKCQIQPKLQGISIFNQQQTTKN